MVRAGTKSKRNACGIDDDLGSDVSNDSKRAAHHHGIQPSICELGCWWV